MFMPAQSHHQDYCFDFTKMGNTGKIYSKLITSLDRIILIKSSIVLWFENKFLTVYNFKKKSLVL